MIEEGNVRVDGVCIKKPSYEMSGKEYKIEITDTCPYVSRRGLKLEGILKETCLDVSGKVCIDIGASTGGFTHCLLLHGAEKIYAIDSGTNQLDESLRENPSVISIENYNARNLSIDDIGEMADVITIDVSFISQKLIIPKICELLNDDGVYLSLIKPQFELGKSDIGKGGIVKDKRARLQAVKSVIECAFLHGLSCDRLIKSPIQGGDGNIEYLACFKKGTAMLDNEIIKKTVLE